jgi:multiple sugar transport system permease protein
VWNSFHSENLSVATGQGGFVGGDNYTKLFQSSEWLHALLRTLAFAGVSVALETVVALGLALMLHRRFRGRGLLRVAILIPWAVPTVVSATLWKTMFDPRAGFVDYVFGLHTTWLAGVWTSWAAILVADAWKNVPFIAIILLAGLQVIPTEIYEAANMDGANWRQSFRRLTLPLLKPALAVALVFRLLSALLVFDVIYIMTGGGPGLSTETLSFLNWQTFLVNTDFGYGGAISVMLVVLCLVMAGVVMRVMRTREAT